MKFLWIYAAIFFSFLAFSSTIKQILFLLTEKPYLLLIILILFFIYRKVKNL
jgi:hypothetical protein